MRLLVFIVWTGVFIYCVHSTRQFSFNDPAIDHALFESDLNIEDPDYEAKLLEFTSVDELHFYGIRVKLSNSTSVFRRKRVDWKYGVALASGITAGAICGALLGGGGGALIGIMIGEKIGIAVIGSAAAAGGKFGFDVIKEIFHKNSTDFKNVNVVEEPILSNFETSTRIPVKKHQTLPGSLIVTAERQKRSAHPQKLTQCQLLNLLFSKVNKINDGRLSLEDILEPKELHPCLGNAFNSTKSEKSACKDVKPLNDSILVYVPEEKAFYAVTFESQKSSASTQVIQMIALFLTASLSLYYSL